MWYLGLFVKYPIFSLESGDLLLAILLSLLCAGALIAVSGHDPLAAFAALVTGAVGSPHQIGAALNRTTPYLLAGSGVALCFRAGIINIGAEGQIAVGGMGTAAVALAWPNEASALAAIAALVGGAAAGAVWAGVATAIHLWRRVHEVLATLLLNFVALLLVKQALAGPLGQFGAGFLQSPLLPRASWLLRIPGFDAHVGFVVALASAAALSFILWRTPFGFAVRASILENWRTEFNITSRMGMTMIIGIVTEIAIFYYSEYRDLPASGERFILAGINRMRPIAMTTFAAILALLPLALGIGQGSAMQQPLAIAIISGLVFGLPLVLFVLPTLLSIFGVERTSETTDA